MAWLSAHQTKPQRKLLVLSVLLICTWPLASARSQVVAPTPVVMVKFTTVIVQLKDQNGQPIKGARISIPRPVPKLDPVEGATAADGRFVSEPNRTFRLDGPEYKLTVTSRQIPGGGAEIALPDDTLRDAFNKTGALSINVKLDKSGSLLATFESGEEKPPPARLVTLPVVVVDENKNPVPNAKVFISQTDTTQARQGDLEENTGPDGKQPITVQVDATAAPFIKLRVEAEGFQTVTKTFNDPRFLDSLNGKKPFYDITVPQIWQNRVFNGLKDPINYFVWVLGWLFLIITVVLYLLKYRIRIVHVGHEQLLKEFREELTTLSGRFNQLNQTVKAYAKPANSGGGPERHLTEGDIAPNIGAKPEAIESHPETNIAGSSTRDYYGRENPLKGHGYGQNSRGFYAGARSSYVNLINKAPISTEPIYLDVEGARSIAGRLEDSNVYLTSVPHSQGAFVLFTDGDDSGWVFPNPTIGFRQVAIKDVFPELTENEFIVAKADIQPRRAKHLEDRRWLVE